MEIEGLWELLTKGYQYHQALACPERTPSLVEGVVEGSEGAVFSPMIYHRVILTCYSPGGCGIRGVVALILSSATEERVSKGSGCLV